MATTETSTTTEPEKAAPPPAEAPAPVTEKVAAPEAAPAATPRDYFAVGDVVLRVLLFAAAVTAVVVMVTSKQTKAVRLPLPPLFPVVERSAKFQDSPAFIYFVAALSVAGLYSIISGLVSLLSLLKPSSSSVTILAHFLILDVLMLGIVAAATGASWAVAYIGLKGNSHVGWTKICNIYGTFCTHIGASIGVSLFASIVLTLLVILAAYSLSKKIPK